MLEQHPGAAHFRYPYVYGPRQLAPREWCIVRRMLDHRPFVIVPDGGLSLTTYGYSENLAHAVLLAVDQPEASHGQIYNCGDEVCLSLRQVVEIIARALDWTGEIVSLPNEIARTALPMRTTGISPAATSSYTVDRPSPSARATSLIRSSSGSASCGRSCFR